jgi:CBS domain-containing protein
MFKVKEIMAQPAITVTPDMPIYDAVRLLTARNLSALPVVDEELHLQGMLSEKDVLSLLYEHQDFSNKLVSDFMTPEVISFDVSDNLIDLCDCFEAHRIRRIPITECGRLTGIANRSDVINAILTIKHEAPSTQIYNHA